VIGTAPQPDVVVIGDSLTIGEWCVGPTSGRAPAQFAAHGLTASVDARIGRRVVAGRAAQPTWVSALNGLFASPEQLPPKIVFSLGTNDAFGWDPLTVYSTELDALVTLAGPDRQVFVLSLIYKGKSPRVRARFAQYNAFLRDYVAARPNVHLIDFETRARAHPRWFGSEGIHPGPAGYRARAELVARSVAECTEPVCPVAPPTSASS
jgi:lysophospholipase L1-like esterase